MSGLLGAGEKLVLLGLGEVARGDKGVGEWAIRVIMRDYDLPPSVTALTAPAPDAELLDALEEASALVAVDYVYAEGAPGAFYRVSLDEYQRDAEWPESVHESALLLTLGVLEMLDRRPAGTLFVVQIGDWTVGEKLSAAVEGSLPDVVDAIMAELAGVGVRLAKRGAV